jgi:ABC-type transport system substrate-binding protein
MRARDGPIRRYDADGYEARGELSVNRHLRILAVAGAVAVIASACAQAPEEAEQPATGEVSRGGTLLAGLESDIDDGWDPQKAYYSVNWGFNHCCLNRTLLSPPGVPAEEGGNELQPDLAAEMPEVSDDGLTYTFRLREDVMWGPPFEDRPIVAEDFITALERTADPKVQAGYSFYYDVIEGFTDFSDGKADTITGLRAVDDHTLEITLARPAGDFPFRMMMPAAAPIPTGAEEGHEKDYGLFIVSSGPYMFEGSEDLNFDLPPDQQQPVSGYQPGRSIVLVRNPSWSSEVDPLRPAYLDRIEVQIGLTSVDMYNKIEAGELDLALDVSAPPPQFLQKYTTDPELEERLHVNDGDGTNYISMNVAEPPFDDVHVRKAVNWAVDKAGLVRIGGGERVWGPPIGHFFFNALLNDLLVDYDPYATPESSGDIDKAKEEMKLSKYDANGDGVCDDPVCEGVVTVVDEADPYPDQARLIAQNLAELGMKLDISTFERDPMYDKCQDPGAHVAFCPSVGWYKDYADAATFGEPVFGSSAVGADSCCNYMLVGAPPELLKQNGYEVTEVPNLDDRFTECDMLPLGDERFQCWAEVDQTIMEEVVPIVPISEAVEAFIIPERMTRYSFDQFSSGPALDQIAVAPE